jgi:hypothetical protein
MADPGLDRVVRVSKKQDALELLIASSVRGSFSSSEQFGIYV